MVCRVLQLKKNKKTAASKLVGRKEKKRRYLLPHDLA